MKSITGLQAANAEVQRNLNITTAALRNGPATPFIPEPLNKWIHNDNPAFQEFEAQLAAFGVPEMSVEDINEQAAAFGVQFQDMSEPRFQVQSIITLDDDQISLLDELTPDEMLSSLVRFVTLNELIIKMQAGEDLLARETVNFLYQEFYQLKYLLSIDEYGYVAVPVEDTDEEDINDLIANDCN